MSLKVVLPALGFWLSTTMVALANGSRRAAPEIDGPGGVAAIALLIGAGLIAYNRYKK